MQVEGKAAIVTGGGTGVGRATALKLAAQGCQVLINYSRSKEDAEKTEAELRGLGVKAVAIQADVADDAACRQMAERAVQEFGRLDVVVNNAGTTAFVPHGDLEGMKIEDWERLYRVNVIGPFQVVRAARSALEASGNAAVVNVSSVAGISGMGSSVAYCASKAALNNLTVTLARALGPSIRVNAVAPGAITGRWLEGGLGEGYDAVMGAIAGGVPLGKVCTPEDVADAILSMITGSDLVTGQVLAVDGGMLIKA